jgi:TRAP-type mannitol/chloroaromatic compound transport system permease small subunit
MPSAIVTFVRLVDGFNRRVGTATMYLIFVMMGILFYSSISKAFRLPANWTLESAQCRPAIMSGWTFSIAIGRCGAGRPSI